MANQTVVRVDAVMPFALDLLRSFVGQQAPGQRVGTFHDAVVKSMDETKMITRATFIGSPRDNACVDAARHFRRFLSNVAGVNSTLTLLEGDYA